MNPTSCSRFHWQAYAVLLAWASLWVLMSVLTAVGSTFNGVPVKAVTFDVTLPVLGIVGGLLVVLLQQHPRRVLGLIPLATFGLVVLFGLLALGAHPSPFVLAACGCMVGVLLWSLLGAYRALPRGHGWFPLVFFFGVWIVGTPFAIRAIFAFFRQDDEAWIRSVVFPILLALAVTGFALSTWLCFRELMELFLELLIWPMHRVKASAPGLRRIPRHGPCLVVANHSSWFDPMWLAKVLPRRLIPMMTSAFYDLPVLRWLMAHAAHAIRVQASGFRRDVPELKEAVAALDRGECLIVFPEGGMRRKEEQPLRQFGQGIWHILKERPGTPVIVCWIEGGWGSYFSYWNGPPTKNKRLDFWRRIEIGVAFPEVIEPSLLAEHRTLRTHLMKACLEARRHLGKEPHQLEERGALSEEET